MKMISNMNKKEKIILFISIFFLVTIIGIGISFAYYTAVVLNGESKSSLISQAGNLEITYVDGEKQILGVSVFPGWQDSKTFTVKNTGDNAATYSIKVTNITNTFTIANSISLSLESSDGGKNMGKRTLPRSEATIVKYVSIDAGDTHTYTVTTYYNNLSVDQSADKGKRFSYTIEVGAAVGTNDTLISQSGTNSSTAKAFNGPITKEQVESITFKNTNAVPSNAVASWDVSEEQNGKVMAYTLDSNNNNLYELYIGQEGEVTLGEDASTMFSSYTNAETLDVSNIDTSNVTNMEYMFKNASVTTIKGLDKFDTSNVTNMTGMFEGCSNVTSLDVTNFDTSKVKYMGTPGYGYGGMFQGCTSLTSLDLSNFDTSNVIYMGNMFRENNKLTTLNISNFNTSNVTNMASMFRGCTSLTTLDLSSFNTSKVEDMEALFFGLSVKNLNLSNFDTSNVKNMKNMFWNNKSEVLDLSNFNTSKVIDMSNMFRDSKATNLDLSSFDTSNVTNMAYMFNNSQATALDLSSFNTSKVTTMNAMFWNCPATTLGLSNFNTSNVTNMASMFYGIKARTLDLSSFDTSNVTNMSYMFAKYPGDFIELLSFNTSKVTDMSYMFWNSSKLDYIDLSSFDTSNVTDMKGMFQNIPLITGYARTSADAKSFNASTTGISTGIEFVVKS